MRVLTRLAMIRATEEALDRRPEQTLAVIRAHVERSARRRTDEPLVKRLGADLTLRAMDAHPAVAERIVRGWLRRAAEREKQALELARSGHRQQRGKLLGDASGRSSKTTAQSQ